MLRRYPNIPHSQRRSWRILGACRTWQEIAEAVEVSRPQVAEIVGNGNLADSDKPAAGHLTDFEPPIYNVWKFKERSARESRTRPASHFGASPRAIRLG